MQHRENKKTLGSQQLDLRDLIGIREWQKIQDNFSTITGVSLRTLDLEGKLFTKQSNKPRMCLLKKELCGNCLPTFLGGRGVVNKNFGFACKTSLHNFLTPLKLTDRVFGYIIIGPVALVARKSKDEYLKIALELGLDDTQVFYDSVLEIKTLSFHGMQSLLELIKDIAEYTLKLAHQNLFKERGNITALPGLTALLNAMLDVAFEISQADIGSIMLLDEKTDELTIQSAKGIAHEIINNTRVKLGNRICGIAAKEAEAFLIDEHFKDNRILSYLERPYLSSSMIIPLKIENRAIGVMNLGALETSPVRFKRDDLKLMQKLVDFTTLAISI
jgi:ligand-binding sensor protein/putative methionine-R-sulfoxide reductase with GAF domain